MALVRVLVFCFGAAASAIWIFRRRCGATHPVAPSLHTNMQCDIDVDGRPMYLVTVLRHPSVLSSFAHVFRSSEQPQSSVALSHNTKATPARCRHPHLTCSTRTNPSQPGAAFTEANDKSNQIDTYTYVHRAPPPPLTLSSADRPLPLTRPPTESDPGSTSSHAKRANPDPGPGPGILASAAPLELRASPCLGAFFSPAKFKVRTESRWTGREIRTLKPDHRTPSTFGAAASSSSFSVST